MSASVSEIREQRTKGKPGRDTAAAIGEPYFPLTPISVHVQGELSVELAPSLSWPASPWVYRRVWFVGPTGKDNAAIGRYCARLEARAVEVVVVDVGAAELEVGEDAGRLIAVRKGLSPRW